MPYRPEYTIEINPNFGKKMGMSKTELKHIGIAVLALSVSFTILYMGVRNFFSTNWVINTLGWFGFSVVAVTFSFLLHELGHKFASQKMGAWAEFRMYPAGLIMGLIVSILGILIAAPGAVMIYGRINDKENALISIAGPAVNGVLAGLFIALSFVTTGGISALLYLIAHLNVVLAIFNMLPIMPFDGSKIYKWSKPVYFVMVAVLIALYLAIRFI
jgi:Zn-dependent protease